MNWNDAIQQLAETHWNPKNRVVAAKEGLSVLIGLDERIQAAVKRKPIAGLRFFSCNECGLNWSERTRDCRSPSNESCPSCNELNHPNDFEEHPEWSVDKSGNLVKPRKPFDGSTF